MKLFLGFVALMLVAGCDDNGQDPASVMGIDGGAGDAKVVGQPDTKVSAPDTKVSAPDTKVSAPDTKVSAPDTGKSDTGGYTPNGVTAKLGPNPCADAVKHPECRIATDNVVRCGWNPATNECFPLSQNTPLCISDVATLCRAFLDKTTYQPGTVLVWAFSAPYTYLGDASGGQVCIPNLDVMGAFATTDWLLANCL
jgi:hypothetical protein